MSGIVSVLDTLATRVAENPRITAASSGEAAVWVVPAREHQWQEVLESALLTALNSVALHRPARGVVTDAVEVSKAVAGLVPAVTSAAGVVGAWRSSRSSRAPLISERELSTLWLAALLGALCERGWSNRTRIASLSIALSRARDGDVVLLSDVTATAVLWVPHRRVLARPQVSALAHWTLIGSERGVLGAGVETDG